MNLDIHWNQNDPEIQNQSIYTTYHDNQHLQQQLLDHHRPVENGKSSSAGKSRFGSMKRATEGEIVQVQGGHILRATGRKDRHSKVYTAKGPRDRRVRLSAHTAIQFYDVQDRLGYDRPSKAVDWLIKKAKNAIDKLDELPPWDPNEDTTNSMSAGMEQNPSGVGLEHEQPQAPQPRSESDSRYEFQVQRQLDANANSSYMMTNPVTTETQSIADTLKSFFPMNSGTSLMNFQNYPHDIMPRSSIQTEDLGLSLHSTLHDQNSNHRASNSSHDHHQALFTSSNPVSFEANYPRIAGWILPQQPFFSQNAAFHQREPLQSNYSHLIHAWEDQRPMTVAETSMSNNHFNAGFQVPARIHGEQEHGHGVVSIKPPTDSPNSRH